MDQSLEFKSIPGLAPIEFQRLPEVIDESANIRLYCTQHKSAWKLQVRAFVPLIRSPYSPTKPNPANYIATASLDRTEMEAIRNMIDEALLEGVELPTVPVMVQELREAFNEPGVAVGIVVKPEARSDTFKIFDILHANKIGFLWQGESRYYIIQSFEPHTTQAWLHDKFGEESVNAEIFTQ